MNDTALDSTPLPNEAALLALVCGLESEGYRIAADLEASGFYIGFPTVWREGSDDTAYRSFTTAIHENPELKGSLVPVLVKHGRSMADWTT